MMAGIIPTPIKPNGIEIKPKKHIDKTCKNRKTFFTAGPIIPCKKIETGLKTGLNHIRGILMISIKIHALKPIDNHYVLCRFYRR